VSGVASAALCLLSVSRAAAQQTAPSKPADDFELLPPEKPPDAAELLRQHQVEEGIARRRALLTVHQAVGLGMLAGLVTTVVLGQLNYQDKYGGGGDTGRWYNAHRDAALITSALFATAGTLALLAPNPTEKRIRLDTVTLHKTFMASRPPDSRRRSCSASLPRRGKERFRSAILRSHTRSSGTRR